MDVSRVTVLEIYSNPADLEFTIGSSEGKWGVLISRGQGHKFKPLLSTEAVFPVHGPTIAEDDDLAAFVPVALGDGEDPFLLTQAVEEYLFLEFGPREFAGSHPRRDQLGSRFRRDEHLVAAIGEHPIEASQASGFAAARPAGDHDDRDPISKVGDSVRLSALHNLHSFRLALAGILVVEADSARAVPQIAWSWKIIRLSMTERFYKPVSRYLVRHDLFYVIRLAY